MNIKDSCKSWTIGIQNSRHQLEYATHCIIIKYLKPSSPMLLRDLEPNDFDDDIGVLVALLCQHNSSQMNQ